MTSKNNKITKLTESLDLAIQALYCIAQQYGQEGRITIDNQYHEFLRKPTPMVYRLEQTTEGLDVVAEVATGQQIREARKELKQPPDYYKVKLKTNPMLRMIGGNKSQC